MSAQDFLRDEVYNVIREYEGFEPNAYMVDGEDFYTIGYGNTTNPDGSPIRSDQVVTRDEADVMMRNKTDQIYRKLMKDPDFASLPIGARSGLTSFSYNTGPNWIDHPEFGTINRALKQRSVPALKDSINLYVNPGTSVEKGLRRRRSEGEAPLFDITAPPVPSNPPVGSFSISPGLQKKAEEAKTRVNKFKTGRYP